MLLETRQPHSFNVIKNASTVNHVESVSVTGTTLHLKKNVQSLTGYSFNTHPPTFTIFGTSLTDIQKSTAGMTFSTTSLLLTL